MTCLAKEKLKSYLNPILIETGTFIGDGVQVAKDFGFDKIISIEVSKILYKKSFQRFQSDGNISIIHGDSSKVLWSIIEHIEERITFVLDAHNLCFGEDTKEDNEGLEWWPLMKELKIIAKHPRKDHTIIVDDIRLFKVPFQTNVEEVKSLLLEINPDYQFCFIDSILDDGGIVKNNILVANIEKNI